MKSWRVIIKLENVFETNVKADDNESAEQLAMQQLNSDDTNKTTTITVERIG